MKQDISGRISVSSYSNLSSIEAARIDRMGYTFSMKASNLGNSGFSAETTIDISGVPEGMYYINIKAESFTSTTPLIIIK